MVNTKRKDDKSSSVTSTLDMSRKLGFVKATESDRSEAQDLIPTFIPLLDKVLGGGIPLKYINEIYAGEGVGKSTFIGYIMGVSSQLGITTFLIDTENATGKRRLAQLGVDPDKVQVFNPDALGKNEVMTIEDVHQISEDFLNAVIADKKMKEQPCLLIWDSIGGTNSQAKNESKIGSNDGVAANAKGLTKMVSRVQGLIDKTNICFIMINQIRNNIQTGFVAPGAPKDTRPSAKALAHAEYLLLRLRRSKKLTGTNNISTNSASGHMVTITTEKNRSNFVPDNQKGTFILYDNLILSKKDDVVLNGIDFEGNLEANAEELSIVKKGGAYCNYTTTEGKEYKCYQKDLIVAMKKDPLLTADMFERTMMKAFPDIYPPMEEDMNKRIDITKFPYWTPKLTEFYKNNNKLYAEKRKKEREEHAELMEQLKQGQEKAQNKLNK